MLHEFTGVIPDTDTPGKDGRSVEGTILALARLDVFIATCLTCLQDDSLDSVGGHRQKPYLDTLIKLLLLTYNQLISIVQKFFNDWYPTDFRVAALSVDSNGVSRDPLTERKVQ